MFYFDWFKYIYITKHGRLIFFLYSIEVMVATCLALLATRNEINRSLGGCATASSGFSSWIDNHRIWNNYFPIISVKKIYVIWYVNIEIKTVLCKLIVSCILFLYVASDYYAFISPFPKKKLHHRAKFQNVSMRNFIIIFY